ncbi:hypothetical protein H6P81_012935 [Aristolochia fimbriata]|uniref:Small acidic protein 1 n=1 Tax=Aristolochia fimbriata TaxID=158543 RepID=A0AAV7EGH2_ARIFI|nr:hypothetical protein H6P81_012935 [Aristolochia fimbriata]
MKPSPTYLYQDFDDQTVTVGMDVDDPDPIDILAAEGLVDNHKPADADFFNAFEDDFDDTDIN